MMPPICRQCGKRFKRTKDVSGLLRFKITEEDRLVNEHMRAQRRVGHPKGAHWFCEDHYGRAKSLTHLYIGEALEIMENPPLPKPQPMFTRIRNWIKSFLP